MKKNKGYVFRLNGKWYARITYTDSVGKQIRGFPRAPVSF